MLFANEMVSSEPYKSYSAVLTENNGLKKNNNIIESNLDKSKIQNHFQDDQVSNLRSDIK